MAAQRALLPIYRLRFNLLYKFGFIEVSPDEWILYDKDTAAGHPDVAGSSLLAKLPTFSTADEVILLDIELPEQGKAFAPTANSPGMGMRYPKISADAHAALDTLAAELSKQRVPGGNVQLSIAQVRRLYPLTAQAGQLLASRLDPRIKRQPAVFEPVAEQADQRLLASETRLGSDALLKIAGFADEPLEEELLQDLAEAVAVRLGQRRIQADDSFWVHLITYDRYEPFPKNDYGYLYDLCVIFYRSLGSQDGDKGYEATGFYKALEANKTALIREIITPLLLTAEWAERLRQALTEPGSGLKKYLSAFLYLKLRQEFVSEDYQFSSRLLDIIRRMAGHYPAEMRVALQLLGGFLTFDKISGAYYEVTQIPLFQDNGRKISRISLPTSKTGAAVQVPNSFKVPTARPVTQPEEIRSDELAVTFELEVGPRKPKEPDLFTPEPSPLFTDEKLVSETSAPSDSRGAASIDNEVVVSETKETAVIKPPGRSRRAASADGAKSATPKVEKSSAAGAARGRKASLANITQEVNQATEAPGVDNGGG